MQFTMPDSIRVDVSMRIQLKFWDDAFKFREGGTDTDIFFAIGECSLGSILVAQSEKGVCSILIGDDPQLLVRDLQDRFPKPI